MPVFNFSATLLRKKIDEVIRNMNKLVVLNFFFRNRINMFQILETDMAYYCHTNMISCKYIAHLLRLIVVLADNCSKYPE